MRYNVLTNELIVAAVIMIHTNSIDNNACNDDSASILTHC